MIIAQGKELTENINMENFTGKCWKHHIALDFEKGNCPTHPNGVGKGGTVFTDFEKMKEYLKEDGRQWYVAELNLNNEPLIFEFNNNYMATIPFDKLSDNGFKPIKL